MSKDQISRIGKAAHGKKGSRRSKKSDANITFGNMALLSRDLQEFVELLNEKKVRYLIVGGYAVGYHGNPRYTKDLDVWIDRKEDNAKRLVQVLDTFGMGSLGLTTSDFIEPDFVIQLGYPPNRIDLLTSLKAVDFEKSYSARIEVNENGLKIKIIDLDSLKRNKRAAGRLKDLADVESLESVEE
jgi:predicted nucleotidyltransferase